MAKIIEDGYLILTDGTNILELGCETIEANLITKSIFKPYDGQVNLGYHLGKEWLEWVATGIWFDSHAKWANCTKYLKDWRNAGTFTLKVERDTTPNYVKWDGDYNTFTVLLKTGQKGMTPKSITQFEDVWYIDRLDFREAGVRSTT